MGQPKISNAQACQSSPTPSRAKRKEKIAKFARKALVKELSALLDVHPQTDGCKPELCKVQRATRHPVRSLSRGNGKNAPPTIRIVQTSASAPSLATAMRAGSRQRAN